MFFCFFEALFESKVDFLMFTPEQCIPDGISVPYHEASFLSFHREQLETPS